MAPVRLRRVRAYFLAETALRSPRRSPQTPAPVCAGLPPRRSIRRDAPKRPPARSGQLRAEGAGRAHYNFLDSICGRSPRRRAERSASRSIPSVKRDFPILQERVTASR